ncbi:hypothetical protein [Paenibacillus sp. GCM10012306]|uniref:hypothetical protein n=1 Tax=Paenibacillus sp. GCM10012306 TaxID=3317342 RepID=UPI0036D25E8F
MSEWGSLELCCMRKTLACLLSKGKLAPEHRLLEARPIIQGCSNPAMLVEAGYSPSPSVVVTVQKEGALPQLRAFLHLIFLECRQIR